jgi:hypothetical protein
VNLVNRQYCIENEQFTKEEYEKRIREITFGAQHVAEFRARLDKLRREHVQRYASIYRCENCNGDYLRNCRNCENCWDLLASEDCYGLSVGLKSIRCMHCSNIAANSEGVCELCLEGLSVLNSYHALFSSFCWYVNNVVYSDSCFNSDNLFGCVGMNRATSSILNLTLAPGEYGRTAARLARHMRETGEWGRFFPAELSFFGYNESRAQDDTPLTRAKAKKLGFSWSDYEAPAPKGVRITSGAELPALALDSDDSVLKLAIACEATSKPFRVYKQEFEFYKRYGLAMPRVHPDQRHKERVSRRNKRKLFTRECHRCRRSLQSSWSQDEAQAVYCESCYQQEVC